MTFQPFGYTFRIDTDLPVEEVKAAIRANGKGWLDVSNGARGWIAGPVLCLWSSAFYSQGPMALAWISSDRFGTRISGRAGSDINGLIHLTVISAFMLVCVAVAVVRGDVGSSSQLLLGGALVLPAMVLLMWFSHRRRFEAEPLVGFLRRCVGAEKLPPRRPRHSVAYPMQTIVPMHLVFSGIEKFDRVSPPLVSEILHRIFREREGFAILSINDLQFLQTAWDGEGFILEKRDGGESDHVFAVMKSTGKDGPREVTHFSLAQIEAAFAGYCRQTPFPRTIEWRPRFT